MTTLTCALWGLAGAALVEGLEFTKSIRHTNDWPWASVDRPGAGPYLASIVIRLAMGMGLAAATGASGQVNGPFGAVAIGVAAPLIIEKLAQQVPHLPDAAAAEEARRASADPVEAASDAR
ncbi:hypothetical protein [Actinomadura sp. NTSP31]|uniref:hypothetical protein n=1 Tax=Actinomadura sp. NTSP31 TaxID=1735447 RepID=UPI0035BF2E8B